LPLPAPAKPAPPLLDELRRAYARSRHELLDRPRGHAGRERDPERRAAAVAARDRDRAAVRVDDRARDEEAEPGAGHLLCNRARRAEEPLEHLLRLAGREPDSRVAHLEHRSVGIPANADIDAPALGRELDRVRDEIVEELEEASLVALEHGLALPREGERQLLA